MRKDRTAVSLQIGGSPTRASVEAFTAGVLRVINSPGGDAVKLAAIEALKSQYSTGPATISNCTFHQK